MNLISQSLPTPSPLGKTSDDVEPLTDIFHCKGVVYSRLPYDTLWEGTPLIDEESDGIICSKADWVTVSALLAALSSGTIREDGKEAKLLQQVPNLEREYALDTLTNLAKQWVAHGSDIQHTPRVEDWTVNDAFHRGGIHSGRSMYPSRVCSRLS